MHRWFLSVFLLVAGAAAGFVLRGYIDESDEFPLIEKREGRFEYINPLLECDASEKVVRKKELKYFREDVSRIVNRAVETGMAQKVTVYFRELNDGIWFSVGDTERFVPASLRKIPMMIALLKQAEKNPGFLSKRIQNTLKSDHTSQQSFKPAEVIQAGQNYTVDELIYRMIAYSDNDAFALLSATVDPSELDAVYSVLSMGRPGKPLSDDFFSVMTYASFFRILYNATYLSHEYSERALHYLSKTYFPYGIVAGLPPQTMVAHKFGEHVDVSTGLKQLHDCGIIYFPQHPYLLCVMSKGKDFRPLADILANVSDVIYRDVTEEHKGH